MPYPTVNEVQRWLSQAEQSALALLNGQQLFEAYKTLLWLTFSRGWQGACHDTSAVLYIVLSEMGLSPTLLIGEVRGPNFIFDHSWVEFENNIFDVAVGFPSEGGGDAGPSVFASLDLRTGRTTELEYGIRSDYCLDKIGQSVSIKNLEEYSEHQDPGATVWDITAEVGGNMGLEFRKSDLRSKYGHVTRVARGQEASA